MKQFERKYSSIRLQITWLDCVYLNLADISAVLHEAQKSRFEKKIDIIFRNFKNIFIHY